MNVIKPRQTIGILGGGQLGQMMAFVAKSMGYRIHSYDTNQDCPLSLISDHHTVGTFDDTQTMLQFCKACDVVTYEFENIDANSVKHLIHTVSIPQGLQALTISSDRWLEYQFVKDLGVNTLDCICVDSKEALIAAMDTIKPPFILKSLRYGYDGHGQIWVHSQEDVSALEINQPYLMMRRVDIQTEISVVCARGKNGVVLFPCIENKHTDGILDVSIVPARISNTLQEKAKGEATKIVEALDYVGVMSFEFFIEQDTLIFNEMAPRPHNSGHFSIEGTTSSQFKAHIEAICGLTIQTPHLINTSMMVNVLGQHLDKTLEYVSTTNQVGAYHDYSKRDAKHNRKMGHMTFVHHQAIEIGNEFRREIRK